MKRVLLIFSSVFAAGLASASPSSPQYEGTFEAKGTSVSGANYDRRFKVTVQFLPRTDIVETAQVDEVHSCNSSNEPSLDCQRPEAFVAYCKTHVSFELGKVRLQVRDTRSGETVTQTLPWTAYVFESVEKSGEAPCVASNLEGKSIVGTVTHTFDLKSAVHGKGTSLYLELEPVSEGASPGDFAMASTLQKISGDQYAVGAFTPNSKAPVNWLYVHEVVGSLTWGSSGSVTLNLKN